MKIIINIPESIYRDINNHLLPNPHFLEEVAFVYARVTNHTNVIRLNYFNWKPILSEEFEIKTRYHFEIKADVISKLIKEAHDSGTSIIEFHSHLDPKFAKFSYTDLSGFADFIPHILWRLKLPYCAVVLTKKGIDALGWISDYNNPIRIEEIITGKKKIRPSNYSFKHFKDGEDLH